jgi:hypothetical protein
LSLMKAPKTEPMKWGRRISETADCMAEREGFEPSVPVHLCFAEMVP